MLSVVVVGSGRRLEEGGGRAGHVVLGRFMYHSGDLPPLPFTLRDVSVRRHFRTRTATPLATRAPRYRPP